LGAPIKPSTAIEVPKVEVVSVARESDSDESQALLREKIALLQHELSLTPSQRLHVEKALRERDSEVAAFHAEIRSSKVLLIWAHDKKAREILAASQARIAAILTPEQSRRYFEILESGRLAEGVSFEISPDLTVIR
jgi:hypothetical protein